MTGLTNLFAEVPVELPEELFQTLLSTPGVRIERIVSYGHASLEGFWYDQETDEWVLLLTGAARLTLEGEAPLDLLPGAFVNIPAHKRHRVEWISEQRSRSAAHRPVAARTEAHSVRRILAFIVSQPCRLHRWNGSRREKHDRRE